MGYPASFHGTAPGQNGMSASLLVGKFFVGGTSILQLKSSRICTAHDKGNVPADVASQGTTRCARFRTGVPKLCLVNGSGTL